MADLSIQGGGVGRWGQRVGGAKDAQVEQPFSIEQAQKGLENVSTTKAPAKTEQVAKPDSATSTQQTQAVPREPKKWAMSQSDVVDVLIRLQQSPTKENQQIISTLLQSGLEASNENFQTILKMLKGRSHSSSSLESAILALKKGLSTSSRSVDVVSHLFADNPQLAGKMSQLQSAMSNFQSLLSANKGLFDPGFFSAFASLMSDVDLDLRKLLKRSGDRLLDPAFLKRGGIVETLSTFSGFLGGIGHKLSPEGANSQQGKAFMAALDALRQHLGGFVDHMVSQAVVSMDSVLAQLGLDDFAYWQLPNVMAQSGKSIELLVKKDGKNEDSFDPNNTKVALNLHTPDIGELAVVLDINDQDVVSTFYSAEEHTRDAIPSLLSDLKDRLETHNYKMVGYKIVEKKLDTKPFLMPTLNLDQMSRVDAEV